MTQHIVFLDRASLQAKVRRPAFAHAGRSTPRQRPTSRRSGCATRRSRSPTRCRCGPPTLAQLPDLKMIAVAATGYDVIDIAYCRERGIAVANIRNYAVHTVPEHAFALILALRRNLFAYRADVERGQVAAGPSSSASSTTRSATCTARRSASSARARSARAGRASRAASACRCCSPTTRRRRRTASSSRRSRRCSPRAT